MSTHEHGTHLAYGTNKKALGIALLITVTVMAVEFIGSFLSGSLALFSDAAHMLTDTAALSLALFALWFSRRPATPNKTFGFYRIEILAALLNGALLIAIAGYIFYQAYKRILVPGEVQGQLMLIIAIIGLAANLVSAFFLSRGNKENLNVKVALWHVLSDAFSSLGVIIGALVITFTGFVLVDSLIGFMIALLVLRGAWKVVKESVDILLEATPKDINFEEVITLLKGVQGVRDIHDLHIWTITSGMRAMSAHVLTNDTPISECGDISKELKNILKKEFHINHATLEFECEKCPPGSVCGTSPDKP